MIEHTKCLYLEVARIEGNMYYLNSTWAYKDFRSIYVTNSMEQSPSWEPVGLLASQETPCLLWNLKVHYHVHKN
jgi:hypothetical protein